MYQVIFADGTFIDGSTSELSCDGPLREPFAVYCQVHTRFSHLHSSSIDALRKREMHYNLNAHILLLVDF